MTTTTTIGHRTADELASFITADRVNGHFGLTVAAADEAVIAQTIDDLLALSGDARWDYLAAQGYSEGDLDNVSAMIMAWRGQVVASEFLDLAETHPDADPAVLVAKWLDDRRVEALGRLEASYGFPSPMPAVCCAIVDIFGTARASIRLADIRRKRALGPPTNWTSGRPEDFEEDLQWAAAGYDEEVALWPAY